MAISGGGGQSLVVKSDGTVVGWGMNIGPGNYVNTQVAQANLTHVTAVSTGEHHWIALKSDGTVVGGGLDNNGRINTSAYSGVDAISAGAHYSLLLIDGKVYGVGQNFRQELNIPADLSDVTAIAAGYYHALALKSDGIVTAWGDGYWGTPGVSAVPAELTGETVVAIAAGDDHSLVLKEDGTVVAWGRNTAGQSTVPADLTDVVDIDAGFQFSLALKSDGKVVAWGNMTVPDGLTDVVDIDAGYSHAMALREDGSVVVWMNGGGTGLVTTVPGSGDLSGLALQEGPLNRPFQASDTDYTFYNSDPERESVHLTATLTDADNAALYINDELQTSGSEVEVDLTGDATSITIRVEPYLLPSKTYTVTVTSDTTAPSIQLNGHDPTLVARNDSFADPGAVALDDVDGDISGRLVITGTVDTSVAGAYSLVYNVTDLSGNPAIPVTRTVQVIAPPSLTLVGPSSMSMLAGGSFDDPGAQASDDYYGSLTDDIVVTGSVYTQIPGIYTLHYNVQNSFGLSAAEVTRTVTVVSAPAVSDNDDDDVNDSAALRMLELTDNGKPVALTPTFQPDTTEYHAQSWSPRVELRAIAADPAWEVTWNGNVLDEEVLIELQEGDNDIELIVHAENRTQKTYWLTVHRASPTQHHPADDMPPNASNPIPVACSDISGHWAEPLLNRAIEEGILTGYPDGTCRSDGSVTRAEFSVLLMNALKDDSVGAALRFSDLDSIGDWARASVAQGVQAGAIRGYPDNTFRPDLFITRAELTKMAVNTLLLPASPGGTTSFIDDDQIPAWVREEVALAQRLGLVVGRGDNRFDPDANATRAEAIAVIMRLLDLIQP